MADTLRHVARHPARLNQDRRETDRRQSMPWTLYTADGSGFFIWISTAFVEVRGSKNFQMPQPSKANIPAGELRDTVEVVRGGKIDYGVATCDLIMDPTGDPAQARFISQGNIPGSSDIIYLRWGTGTTQYVRMSVEITAPGPGFAQGGLIEGQASFRLLAAPTYPTTVPLS